MRGRDDRFSLLSRVIDTSFEPSLLVGFTDGADGLGVLAANVAAADLFVAAPERRLPGRKLTELMPWAQASGLLDALREVLETGTPLRIHEHGYEDVSEAGGRVRPRSVSVGALRIEPGLLLVTLRPNRGTAGTDPGWEEKLHRLAGTGPWEWDVRAGTIYWYAQALAVLGSSLAPGPLPADHPPYRVQEEDASEHESFLHGLIRDGRAGHVEVRVLQPPAGVRHIRFGADPDVPHRSGGLQDPDFGVPGPAVACQSTEERVVLVGVILVHGVRGLIVGQRSRCEAGAEHGQRLCVPIDRPGAYVPLPRPGPRQPMQLLLPPRVGARSTPIRAQSHEQQPRLDPQSAHRNAPRPNASP